ncbi:MAG TPA: pyridoxal phosphate-dependent aminotransferase [Patescibacteria group bacterium]|nr:pyridoxal phosphate-dependent aminotransferase [Patescibacteria group bacterium]
MYRISRRATDVPNSGIGYMMRYASKYPDTVSLGQGTPLFPTPQFIYDYVFEYAKKEPAVGMYSDTKVETELNLKHLIAKQMSEEYGFTPEMSQLYITVGAIGGLFSAIMALIDRGDEIIYFDPSYPLHLSQIHIAQGKPVFVPYREREGWSIDLVTLKKSITKKTRAILLTNPNNPTGTVLSETEVRELSDIVIKNDLVLILDEAYFFLTYGKSVFSPLRIPEMRSRTILCRSFSKEFAMTGWRVGYAYAAEELIEKINSIHIYFSVAPPTPAIIAATAALSDPRGKVAMDGFKKKFTESRTAICERLNRLPKLFSYHPPDGAYYVFPKYLEFDMPASDFAKLLVDETKVITAFGSSMGPAGAGHIRMSFAADASIIHAAFDRLDAFAKKHNLL